MADLFTRAVTLCACGLFAAVGLSACGGSASAADTVVQSGAARVVTPNGVAHTAAAGELLLPGETVLAEGPVTLASGGRRTWLAAGAAVVFTNASALSVQSGDVVVDRHKGGSVQISAGGVVIDDLGHTAVRIERTFSVRVAVYDGGSARVGSAGRTLVVPALHEVVVPGTSLPVSSAPLALTDDALDRVADAGLVAADTELEQRAAGLDGPGGNALAAVLPAAFHRVLPAVDVSPSMGARSTESLSEQILPVAIAASVHEDRNAAYSGVRELRAAGGSWGVVAALVDARVSSVQDEITAIADTSGAGAGAEHPKGSTTVVALGADPANGHSDNSSTGTGNANGPSVGTSPAAGTANRPGSGTGAAGTTGSAAGSGNGSTKTGTSGSGATGSGPAGGSGQTGTGSGTGSTGGAGAGSGTTSGGGTAGGGTGGGSTGSGSTGSGSTGSGTAGGGSSGNGSTGNSGTIGNTAGGSGTSPTRPVTTPVPVSTPAPVLGPVGQLLNGATKLLGGLLGGLIGGH